MSQQSGRSIRKIFNKAVGYALLSLVLVSLFLFAMSLWLEQRLLAETQADFQQSVNLYGATLLQTVNRELSFINGMNTHMETGLEYDGFVNEDELIRMAAGIYEASTGLRNIAIAPGGVMAYVYPLEGNQSVLGYEPAKDERENVRHDVERAIATGEVILSLPIELIQGGQGVIARQAIFYQGEYWGLTNIVIDLPFLLENAGITQEDSGVRLALKDQAGQVFYGSPDIFNQAPAIYEIPLEEGNWTLAGVPTEGWQLHYQKTLNIYRYLSVSIALLCAVLVYVVSYRQGELELMVVIRTQELSNTNKQLQEDILAREVAENELRVSEARANALLDAIPDMIFRLTREGEFLDYTAESEDLYVGVDNVVGRNMRELFAASFANTVLDRIAETLASEELIIFEYALGYEDDSQKKFEARMVVSGNDEVTVIIRDITVRKRRDLEIQKLNEELEKRVISRTAKLDATVKDLESFSYSISHDLRAPLRAINGYSHLLERGSYDILNDEAKIFLERIKTSSARMDDLINDLLMLSRLGLQKFDLNPLSLNELVQKLFEELSAESEASIEFQVNPCPPQNVDAALMKLLLSNLIANAIKFTDKTRPIELAFGCTESNGEVIYFLQDNGVGFDMAYVDKLFIPFQRLHSESQFEGTGIGLAIVKRVIDIHNGRIWIESKPGEGTTVFFTIGDKIEVD